jgi:hypothetical protein
MAEDSTASIPATTLIIDRMVGRLQRAIDSSFFGNETIPYGGGAAVLGLESLATDMGNGTYQLIDAGSSLENIDWATDAITVVESQGAMSGKASNANCSGFYC